MEDLHVHLILPEKSYPLVKAKQVSVPLIDGYATILPGHTKFLSPLGTGIIGIENVASGRMEQYFVSGGFIEVADNQVNLLADVSEEISEINVGRAKKAKERAEQRLKAMKSDTDMVRAQAALLRANARIASAGMGVH